MAPNINNPGGVKNDPDEIRDGVVSDATRFPGGFIDQQITEAGAAVQIVGQFQLSSTSFIQSFDVSPQDSDVEGLVFKPDGSQLYVIGKTNTNVYQYSLSTAFDVTSASFVRSFDVSTQDTGPSGLAFKPDGSRLYVVGGNGDNVYQYSLSTAFDVSTASFVQSFDVSTQGVGPAGVAFKPDGSRMYVIDNDRDRLFQYSLSTAFDISTASVATSLDVSPQDTTATGLAFKPDGSQVYVVGVTNTNAYQYSLTTSFDVSTASFVRSLDISPQDGNPRGLAFKPDGSQLYVIGRANTNVYQYAVGVVGGELG
jgi:sugar lactone lactonase YvrE